MPLYNYSCKKCSNEFEAYNSIAEREGTQCPMCNEIAQQTICRPAVHGFKFGHFEHTSHNGDYAHSRRELKEICRRNECWAPGVLD